MNGIVHVERRFMVEIPWWSDRQSSCGTGGQYLGAIFLYFDLDI